MTRLTLLPSHLSRLGRESDMLDTIITMMGDERLDADTAHGTPRRTVVANLATRGFDLAQAIWDALGETPPAFTTTELDDVRARYRESQQHVRAAAARLGELDADLTYGDLTLRPEEVVPQRIAEVVLANEAVSSLWSLDEADPDSVRDALDALVRRLDQLDDVPPLTLTTLEGDEWLVHGGGQAVHGTRESLASWLAYGEGESALIEALPDLPHWA